MTRYRWDETRPFGKRWVEIDEDAERAARRARPTGPAYMPDISEFQAPLGNSPAGTRIGSRSQLREFEQQHGVRQCGELKTLGDFDNTASKPYAPAVPE